ncbi:MAG: hypothetical protein K6G63_08050 [Eubacterium sp.]|nr:hypothetical protein [Eubacterium sp.]
MKYNTKRSRILAVILAFVMLVTVIPELGNNTREVSAAGSTEVGYIDLGSSTTVSKSQGTYRFNDPTIEYTGKDNNDKLTVYSIRVNSGYFMPTSPDNVAGSGIKFKGVTDKSDYVEKYSNSDRYKAVTITGSNITTETIVQYIKNIVFTQASATTPQTVYAAISSVNVEDLAVMVGEDGKLHFYEFVRYRTENNNADNGNTWQNAYAAAKKKSFNGMKGYLATITSAEEQEFVVSALGTVEGWIGATRYVYMDGIGVTHDNTSSADDDADTYKIMNEVRTQNVTSKAPDNIAAITNKMQTWYWVDGPEAGEAFYKGLTGTAINDAFNKSHFSNWNLGSVQEPNNYNNREMFATYAYNGAANGGWNDWANRNTTVNVNSVGAHGYYIEYSPYDKGMVNPGTNPGDDTVLLMDDEKTVNVSSSDINIKIIKNDTAVDLMPNFNGEERTISSPYEATVTSDKGREYVDFLTSYTDNAYKETYLYKTNSAGNKTLKLDSFKDVEVVKGNNYFQVVYVDNKGDEHTYTFNIFVDSDVEPSTPTPKPTATPTESPTATPTIKPTATPVVTPALASNTITSAQLNRTSIAAGDDVSVIKIMSGSENVPVNDQNAKFEWQLYAGETNGWVPLPGATSSIYVVEPQYTMAYIRCKVTGSGEYNGTVYVDATGSYAVTPGVSDDFINKAVPGDTDPSINGLDGSRVQITTKDITFAQLDKKEVNIGETIKLSELRAGAEDVAINDLNANYQWQVFNSTTNKWENIPGATDRSYTAGSEVAAKKIRLKVTGKNSYSGTVYVDAEGYKIQGKTESDDDANNVKPYDDIEGENGSSVKMPINGNPRIINDEKDSHGQDVINVGTVLKADISGVGPEDVRNGDKLDYQWYIVLDNGSLMPIAGAKSPTLTVNDDIIDEKVVVRVTGKDPYYGTVESAPYELKRTVADIDINPQPVETGKPEKIVIKVNPTDEDTIYAIFDKVGNQLTNLPTKRDGVTVDAPDANNPEHPGYYKGTKNGIIEFTVDPGSYIISAIKVAETIKYITTPSKDIKTEYSDNNTPEDKNDDTGNIVVEPADKDIVYSVMEQDPETKEYKVVTVSKDPTTGEYKSDPKSSDKWTTGGDDVIKFSGLEPGTTYKIVAVSTKDSSVNPLAVGGGTVVSTPTEGPKASPTPSGLPNAPGNDAKPKATPEHFGRQGERLNAKTVELNIPTIVMKKIMGRKMKFKIKLLNFKKAKVRCSSSNKKIATINKKGLVKTKKKLGKAKLIINATKGKRQIQYIVNLKVRKNLKKNYSLYKYKTKYKAPSVALYKLIPTNKAYKVRFKHLSKKAKVKYKSSKKKIAKVTKKGKVKPKKIGRTDVTISIKQGGVKYKYFVVCRVAKKGKESNTSYLRVIK